MRSNKTVFSSKDIALLWQESNPQAARTRLNYYVKKGELYHPRKGLYTKNKNYNPLELATRIFTPAYVSFESALAIEGVIFQHYATIFVASYLTREITIDNRSYSFKKIKIDILVNPMGIEQVNETSIATKERAFLDTLYLNTDYYFDNLRSLDWDKVSQLLPIYNNKRLAKVVTKLRRENQT
ncbi:MAG: hypothetical protein WAV56_03655 [Microgenomates group bacterium]